jgi:hypothetical protein
MYTPCLTSLSTRKRSKIMRQKLVMGSKAKVSSRCSFPLSVKKVDLETFKWSIKEDTMQLMKRDNTSNNAATIQLIA